MGVYTTTARASSATMGRAAARGGTGALLLSCWYRARPIAQSHSATAHTAPLVDAPRPLIGPPRAAPLTPAAAAAHHQRGPPSLFGGSGMQLQKLPGTLLGPRPGRRLLGVVLALLLGRLLWRAGRWVWHLLTGVDRSTRVLHNAVPPDGWKHAPVTQQASLELVGQHYPELVDLVESGALVAIRPAELLREAMAQRAAGGGAEPPQREWPFGLGERDQQELLQSRELQACLAAPAPEVLFVLGTVHVSKQSAQDVDRVIKAVKPALCVLELCRSRMQAMLLDPYADPLRDLEPCPEKAKAQAALRHRGTVEILRAALASRDHNVLMQLMSGFYGQLEEQLDVKAGVEFIAARRALIQLAAEEEAELAAAAAEGAAAAGARVPNWMQRCVPGDRPVADTLLGLWGSLGPWSRVRFISDLCCSLMSEIDEETIASLQDADVVELLLQEFAGTYPTILMPLLHDRNWVLSTNLLAAAQRAPGPVLAVVGKGHIPGMVFAVQRVVSLMAALGGGPVLIRAAEGGEADGDEGEGEDAALE